MKKISKLAKGYENKEQTIKAFNDGVKILKNIINDDQNLLKIIKEIPKKTIMDNLAKLISICGAINNCKVCNSYKECKSPFNGHTPSISYLCDNLIIETEACAFFKSELRKRRTNNRYLLNHYPQYKNIILEDIDIYDTGRNKLIANLHKYFISNKGFYLWGLPKIGKTFLTFILANKFIDLGETVAFVDINQIFKEIKAGYDKNENTILPKLYSADNLFLDELASGRKFSNFEENEFIKLISERAKKGKTTFFISNYSPQNFIKRSFRSKPISIKIDDYINNELDSFKISGKRR